MGTRTAVAAEAAGRRRQEGISEGDGLRYIQVGIGETATRGPIQDAHILRPPVEVGLEVLVRDAEVLPAGTVGILGLVWDRDGRPAAGDVGRVRFTRVHADLLAPG